MRLRTFGLISTLVLGLLAGPLPTEAQQAGKVYRIGVLSKIIRQGHLGNQDVQEDLPRDDIDLLQDVPDVLKLLPCTKNYE